MNRYLVTTALEDTWPEENVPVLFLGEWCKLYSRRSKWENMNIKVLGYHWDDRNKLHVDFEYLCLFYHRCLKILSDILNEYHGVDYSLRYWQIIIGPWLGEFIYVVFDRWSTIKQLHIIDNILEHKIICYDDTIVPKTFHDFADRSTRDDWNSYFFGFLLCNYSEIPCQQIKTKHLIKYNNNNGYLKTDIYRKNNLVKNIVSYVLNHCHNKNDIFIYETGLKFQDRLHLGLFLKQIPQITDVQYTIVEGVNKDARNQIDLNLSVENEFEEVFINCVIKFMPIVYLEGYNRLNKKIDGLKWPEYPRLIWTSTGYYYNELFKFWTASKVERGSSLVLSQHGGFEGIAKDSFAEMQKISVCDRYWSWGWDNENKKVVSVGANIKRININSSTTHNNKLLLLTLGYPRYASYGMGSQIISGQWLKYNNALHDFVKYLSNKTFRSLSIKLFDADYEWSQKSRWIDRFPNIKIENDKQCINKLYEQSRLVISTYNGTVFLETISKNIPTVIFWEPCFWELRESAKIFIEELEKVGVFHKTPVSAARHIENIWDDVEGWWLSNSVRDAVDSFRNNYASSPKNYLEIIYKEICNII